VKFTRYRHYLSVISASGCETIVMNQMALKNSDQNVSKQIQNIWSYSRNADGVLAIDPLLQNGRRLEHHHARNRRFGVGLRVTGGTPSFLAIFRHGSFSLFSKYPEKMRIAA
jgi:hypothetical protein